MQLSTGDPEFLAGQNGPSTDLTVEARAQRINDALATVRKDMLAAARVCAEEDRGLSAAERREIRKRLNCSPGMYSQFVQIGSDERLFQPEVQKHLPTEHHSMLYPLTRFTNEQLRVAIDEGIVKPNAKRQDIRSHAVAIGVTKPRKPRAVVPSRETFLDPENLADLSATYRQFGTEFSIEALKGAVICDVIHAEYALLRLPRSLSGEERGCAVTDLRRLRDSCHTELIGLALPAAPAEERELL